MDTTGQRINNDNDDCKKDEVITLANESIIDNNTSRMEDIINETIIDDISLTDNTEKVEVITLINETIFSENTSTMVSTPNEIAISEEDNTRIEEKTRRPLLLMKSLLMRIHRQ